MNIFIDAKNGKKIKEIEYLSKKENIDEDFIYKHFIKGEIVIFKNRLRDIDPVAVGKGLLTKVNANLGSSPDITDINLEIDKAKIAIDAGADAIMDLSIGEGITFFRREILKNSSVPLGTVPLYEAAAEMGFNAKSVIDMDIKDYLKVIKRQAEEGVDFMTIHSGVTLKSIESLNSQKRIVGITSRGGSILAEWMLKNKKENPLYE